MSLGPQLWARLVPGASCGGHLLSKLAAVERHAVEELEADVERGKEEPQALPYKKKGYC